MNREKAKTGKGNGRWKMALCMLSLGAVGFWSGTSDAQKVSDIFSARATIQIGDPNEPEKGGRREIRTLENQGTLSLNASATIQISPIWSEDCSSEGAITMQRSKDPETGKIYNKLTIECTVENVKVIVGAYSVRFFNAFVKPNPYVDVQEAQQVFATIQLPVLISGWGQSIQLQNDFGTAYINGEVQWGTYSLINPFFHFKSAPSGYTIASIPCEKPDMTSKHFYNEKRFINLKDIFAVFMQLTGMIEQYYESHFGAVQAKLDPVIEIDPDFKVMVGAMQVPATEIFELHFYEIPAYNPGLMLLLD
jgi:hypothetical protein